MTIEALKQYEHAALAADIFKDRGSYALTAMREQYNILGVDPEDPIINRALSEAAVGIQNGQISNAGVFEAMAVYSGKYNKAFEESTVGDYMQYAEDKGYKKVPEKIKELAQEYATVKIKDLAKEAKDNGNKEKAQKAAIVLNTVGVLREQVMEGVLYPDLVEQRTRKTLEALVREE